MKLKNKNVVVKNLFDKEQKQTDDDSEAIFLPFLKTGINEVYNLQQDCFQLDM